MLMPILLSSVLYVASSLGGIRDPTGWHQVCSDLESSLFALDRDNYKSNHVEASFTCRFVGLEIDYLDKALAAGKIPLVMVNYTVDGHLNVEIIHASLQDPPRYIAFSHVWSDGRGNLGSNTLPDCEVNRLYQRALALQIMGDSNILFWIDTLCVPSKGEFRRVATGRMRKTYEIAWKVLVLDGELEAASMNTIPGECLMRITCPGWMRRL